MLLVTPCVGARGRHFDGPAPDAVTRRSDLRDWQARRRNAVGSQTPLASTCWNLHLLHDRRYQSRGRWPVPTTRESHSEGRTGRDGRVAGTAHLRSQELIEHGAALSKRLWQAYPDIQDTHAFDAPIDTKGAPASPRAVAQLRARDPRPATQTHPLGYSPHAWECPDGSSHVPGP